jgi:predicted component of type VI protein secretion system
MPVLKLSFGNSELKELPIGENPVTIGRSPQGDLFIDNPAVSFHHARVFSQAGVYYVEDLGSLNGTFLNGIRITHAPLTHGDVITVGKHSVRFSRDHPGEKPQAHRTHQDGEEEAPKLTGTMVLDTKVRRELQARLAEGLAAASSERAARLGKLTVLRGRTTAKEFLLTSQTSIIGKSDECVIRLKGWFAPKIAAMISKQGETYHLSPSAKKVSVNGLLLTAKVALQEGDLVAVGRVQFQFSLCPGSRRSEGRRQWAVGRKRREGISKGNLLIVAELSDKDPLTPAPFLQGGEGRARLSLRPRSLSEIDFDPCQGKAADCSEAEGYFY